MKKGVLLFILTPLAGLAAGLVRAMQLAFAFDAETQLVQSGHPATVILLCLTGVFILAAVWLSARFPIYRPGPARTPPALWFVSEVAACFLLLFSSGYALYGLRGSFHAVILIYNLLGAFAALSVLASALYTRRGVLTASTGFYYTVPIFWCCFALVLDFWSHSANPVIISFVFGMFALIFTALSVHAAAGYFFGRPRSRRSIAYCALGLFFSVLTLASLALYPLFNSSEGVVKVAITTPGDMARLGFMILHIGALFYAVLSGAFRTPEESPAPSEAPAKDVPLSAEADESPDTLQGDSNVEQLNLQDQEGSE